MNYVSDHLPVFVTFESSAKKKEGKKPMKLVRQVTESAIDHL